MSLLIWVIQRGKIFIALFFIAIIFMQSCGDADAAAQRMLLLPDGGSITVGAGGTNKIHAMCLDSYRDNPQPEDQFSKAPGNLGSATVKVGGAPFIPLQEAIDKNILELHGDGSHGSVAVTSLVSQPLTINIASTSVIAPQDFSKTDDLTNLDLINQQNPSFSQDQLWETTHQARLTHYGWQDQEFAEVLDGGFSAEDILPLHDAGWTKNEIISLGDEIRLAMALSELGWDKDSIKNFSGSLLPIIGLTRAQWTKDEIEGLKDDINTVADLAMTGWTREDVKSVENNVPQAARLARVGWTVDEVKLIQTHIDAAVELAEAGLSAEQVYRVRNHIEDSAKLAQWTVLKGQNSSDGRLFSLQRVLVDGLSNYILFSSDHSALYVEGNHNLNEVGIRIREVGIAADDSRSPQVILIGDGQQRDFDAVQMTVLTTDAGGGGAKVPLAFVGLPDDFPPGGGGGWNYSEKTPDDLPIAYYASGKRSKLLKFLNRGEISISVSAFVVSKWQSLLAAMSIGVEDAKDEPGASTMSRDDLEESINRHIQKRINQEKVERNITTLPPDAAIVEFNLDSVLSSRRYVEIFPMSSPKFVIATSGGL
ncbi:hypothetical protein [Rhizobium sp. CCGE 510]|uniref:hypothetical protein n=1 Tax=Rhizobium sp. CCGE 510 TaxID=1132836 RepID=UPI00027B8F4F|nr:hypothetical protein [Rhizobium sp. CCGE 510]EJT06369.1 hypothetical protein RCCGE510_04542 [Rhizobium sp. CCGE 510]